MPGRRGWPACDGENRRVHHGRAHSGRDRWARAARARRPCVGPTGPARRGDPPGMPAWRGAGIGARDARHPLVWAAGSPLLPAPESASVLFSTLIKLLIANLAWHGCDTMVFHGHTMVYSGNV